MASFSLDGCRRQWPRVGGVLAMALGRATALASGRTDAIRHLPQASAPAQMRVSTSTL
jgi:hypothetical protein